MIRMIVAADRIGAIGWSDGRLAYQLPNDLKRFKILTTGSTVVMGHNTYRSLNRPQGLPNRRNIVLSRRPYAELAHEIDSSIEVISSFDGIQPQRDADIWVIGGAQVYDRALDSGILDEIHLTLVHAESDADVRLLSLDCWKLFTIREAVRGRRWRVQVDPSEIDGGHQTTYIVFRRI